VATVCGVIKGATEHWVLWEIPYARALHYENIFWMMRGVALTSSADENRRKKRALTLVRGL